MTLSSCQVSLLSSRMVLVKSPVTLRTYSHQEKKDRMVRVVEKRIEGDKKNAIDGENRRVTFSPFLSVISFIKCCIEDGSLS